MIRRGGSNLVILTGHELTAASSAVAVLAILGGYLGIRAANRNAVKIASEERSSRQRDEFKYLKRSTYARFLEALTTLAMASIEEHEITADPHIRGGPVILAIEKQENALAAVRSIAAELSLLIPELDGLANESIESATTCNRKDRQAFEQAVTKLRIAMHHDLEGSGIPNLQELDRLAHTAIAAPSPSAASEDSAATSSIANGETTDVPSSSA
jgi:hypothetical protein